MTSNSIQIYEFSTGIYPERTADGGWVSRGFTGQYMNATIDVPYAVERSIANKEFAIAEGASSDDPAIIGRVVLGNQQPDWSVVAIVTRGRDEKGRKPSLYRYFISEGANSLWKILAWIEDYQRQNGKMPVYDPFEIPERPHQWTVSAQSQLMLSPEAENLPHNPSSPILLPPGQGYTFQTVHRLAIKKSANNQPVSWAFNVEAVEEPRRFLVIQAASQKAYQILERAIANSSQIVPAVSVDEQAIKSTLKGLMNNSTVKREYVHTLAQSIANPQISQPYWNQIFDSQGAGNAIKQGIYSPQMVRLLMLRAIAIPQTLPEYLTWLEQGTKQNDPSTVAAEFEAQFKNCLDTIRDRANIEGKISEGFQVLLSYLLAQKISPSAANRLLASPDGLWTELSRQFVEDVEHDLNLMKQFSSGYPNLPFRLSNASWQEIWKDLQIYWLQRSADIKENYQPFAELFAKLEKPKISAFFYQVASGKVPKKIFDRLQSDGWYAKIYEVVVFREVTITEWLLKEIIKLGSKIVPVALVVPLVFLGFAFGFFFRGYFPAATSHNSNPSAGQVANKPQNSNNSYGSAENNNLNTQMNDEEKRKAIDKFEQTRQEIKKIVAELKKDESLKDSFLNEDEPEQEIENALISVLNYRLLDYQGAIENKEQDKEKLKIIKYQWIEAIYLYQKSKQNPDISVVGYLVKNGSTNEPLKNDTKAKIQKSPRFIGGQ